MRKLALGLFITLFVAVSVAQDTASTTTQPTGPSTATVAGCVTSINGSFKLLTPGQRYTLKGHNSELFGYNGMLIEVTGTVEQSHHTAPGYPITLHVTKLKKLADSCH